MLASIFGRYRHDLRHRGNDGWRHLNSLRLSLNIKHSLHCDGRSGRLFTATAAPFFGRLGGCFFRRQLAVILAHR